MEFKLNLETHLSMWSSLPISERGTSVGAPIFAAHHSIREPVGFRLTDSQSNGVSGRVRADLIVLVVVSSDSGQLQVLPLQYRTCLDDLSENVPRWRLEVRPDL